MNGYWRSILFSGVALNLFAWGLALSEGWVLIPGTFAAGIGCAEFIRTRNAARLKPSLGPDTPDQAKAIERIQALEMEVAELSSEVQRLRAERDFDKQLIGIRGSTDANSRE